MGHWPLMKQQRGTGSKSLRPGQVTSAELTELIGVVTEGSRSIIYTARWNSDDVASGTDVAETEQIEDATDLRSITVRGQYDGNHSGQQVTGGFQGLPVMASRSALRMLSPCLPTVEM